MTAIESGRSWIRQKRAYQDLTLCYYPPNWATTRERCPPISRS
jgi:hypothetical protein